MYVVSIDFEGGAGDALDLRLHKLADKYESFQGADSGTFLSDPPQRDIQAFFEVESDAQAFHRERVGLEGLFNLEFYDDRDCLNE